jgi:hypothetical protein
MIADLMLTCNVRGIENADMGVSYHGGGLR